LDRLRFGTTAAGHVQWPRWCGEDVFFGHRERRPADMDAITIDIGIGEKTAWMLRSLLA
jgi:hypothetical protein